ncbi:MAG TPA: HAMP domain-containing sensor histidine kinase [Tepidisphaeraceae bacterium]|nr:HAMP domain-containing sensor histidine kinase [Tepidisphaeraceae bacterium]
MTKWLRQLNISLAAKCQLLFGAAVVLIIAAALAVPWHRIEELTDQLNDGPAEMLKRHAVAEHMAAHLSGVTASDPATRPATQPSVTSLNPDIDQSGAVFPPRLIGLASAHDRADLSPFEHQKIAYFTRYPDAGPVIEYYRNSAGRWRFHYMATVFLRSSCQACHALPQGSHQTLPFGVMSIDMPSLIDNTQQLRNRLFIVAAGFLAGTLAIVVFYLITTRLILQPVRVLQETAEKVSQGDLNIRSDINTGDEFQQLSETFNTMLANLKDSADQLRSINKGLDLKLGQLAETNVALYESNRLKSEFLANVSHELRTPLNSILGFADLLKDSLAAGPDSKSARYVNNILSSSRHLLELINDLLDLAKIEAGRMEIRSEPLSVPDLFEGLGNILKPLLEQKNLMLANNVGTEVPIIRTDPGKLQQILYNFLSNAIKFSPTGGLIELAAHGDGPDHVRITVSDRGPGIEPSKQQLIFEKFRQVDASVTRTHSGTGLGLAISKELTTFLNGSIGVLSSPGHGATFWIVIPLHIEPGATDVRGKLVLAQ